MVEQPLFVVSSGKVEWVLCGSVTKRKGKEKKSLLGILVKDIKHYDCYNKLLSVLSCNHIMSYTRKLT